LKIEVNRIMRETIAGTIRSAVLSAVAGVALAGLVVSPTPGFSAGLVGSVKIAPPIDAELIGLPEPILFDPSLHSYRIATLVPEAAAPEGAWASASASYDNYGEGCVEETLFTSVGGLQPNSTYTLRVWRKDNGQAVDLGQFTTNADGYADIFYSSNPNPVFEDPGNGGLPGDGPTDGLLPHDGSELFYQVNAIRSLQAAATPALPLATEQDATFVVTGTVAFVDVEGGVWTLQSDDGVVYELIQGADPSLRVDGQRATVELDFLEDVATIYMVGLPARVVSVIALGDEVEDDTGEITGFTPPTLLQLPDRARPVTALNEVNILDANGRLVMSGALTEMEEYFRPVLFAATADALPGVFSAQAATENAAAAQDAVLEGRARLPKAKNLVDLLNQQHILGPVQSQQVRTNSQWPLKKPEVFLLAAYTDGKYIGQVFATKKSVLGVLKLNKGKVRPSKTPALDAIRTLELGERNGSRVVLRRRLQN